MRRSVIIDEIGYNDLEDAITRRVQEANEDLVRVLREISCDVMLGRRVITSSEACAYFDHKVNEATVRKYIKKEGLPANKVGRQYLIDRNALMDWQLSHQQANSHSGDDDGDGCMVLYITEQVAPRHLEAKILPYAV
jgi:excisionase family DNA binding protein